jgi:hypothetical protein
VLQPHFEDRLDALGDRHQDLIAGGVAVHIMTNLKRSRSMGMTPKLAEGKLAPGGHVTGVKETSASTVWQRWSSPSRAFVNLINKQEDSCNEKAHEFYAP